MGSRVDWEKYPKANWVFRHEPNELFYWSVQRPTIVDGIYTIPTHSEHGFVGHDPACSPLLLRPHSALSTNNLVESSLYLVNKGSDFFDDSGNYAFTIDQNVKSKCVLTPNEYLNRFSWTFAPEDARWLTIDTVGVGHWLDADFGTIACAGFATGLPKFRNVKFHKFGLDTEEWDDAPEWANYLAFDRSGTAYWHKDKPTLCEHNWKSDKNAVAFRSISHPSWKTTLIERPINITTYKITDQELVIVRGLPGSGKTTYAQDNYPRHLHYEPDHLFCDCSGEYRFEAQLWQEAVDWVVKITDTALARGESVVVSDVFPTAASVEQFDNLARFHNVHFSVITLTNEYRTIHNIPQFVINRMRQEFEPDYKC